MLIVGRFPRPPIVAASRRKPAVRRSCFALIDGCEAACQIRCYSLTASVQCKEGNRPRQRGGYIDEWFASIVKPASFYEMHASGTGTATNNGANRCYFYNIDLQGRLFLEETMPKNVATSIKDTRFLDFFYHRLRLVHEDMHAWMEANEIPVDDYPFVSPCGKELNFVRPAATPIVFHSLTPGAVDNDETTFPGYRNLVFGGTMLEPFDDQNGIMISRKNGRLYHRLTAHTLDRRPSRQSKEQVTRNILCPSDHQYGLIKSSIAVALSDRILPMEDGHSDMMGFETAHHGLVPIPWLPLEAEPGSWSMPDEALPEH